MKAFAKLGHEPGEAGIREIARPEPGLEEVLLRVAACGVCGSDLHAYRSDPGYEFVEPPTVLGHEFAGTVEEVGDGVQGFGPGDRVVAIAIQGCGRCETCRLGSTHLCPRRRVVRLNHDGGMSEYVVVAERHLVRVPDGLDLEIASLAEPLSVAVHAVFVRAWIQPGHAVVVTGPGPCCRGNNVELTAGFARKISRPGSRAAGFPQLVVGRDGAAGGLRCPTRGHTVH